MTWIYAASVLFLAAFTQSLTGFGLALVSMPLLSLRLGLPQATALVAVVSLFIEAAILRRYWRHLDGRPVRTLIAASLLGVPVGVVLLRYLPPAVMVTGLGLVLVGYSSYALLGWRLPPLRGRAWPWVMGLLAGALGGAYNTSGPPIILYGHAQAWPPPRFKANLQAFFLVNSGAVFLAHWLAGHVTVQVWAQAGVALPAMALGIWLGGGMDRWLSPAGFRRLVLVLLWVLGVKMLW